MELPSIFKPQSSPPKSINFKKTSRKWFLRLSATGLFIVALLIGIVLNPNWAYANKTVHGQFCVYHQTPLPPAFAERIDEAYALVKSSELYHADVQLDICLNDGSHYPVLMEKLRGAAFAWGFYDKVVLMGNANWQENLVTLRGYQWNLVQLLAHEMTHCLQYNAFGFWGANPVAGHPNWKWEGYPEYVARKAPDQLDLRQNIARKITAEKMDPAAWAIELSDHTVCPKDYYDAWILVQYYLDIKHLSFRELLQDSTSEEALTEQMMAWYAQESPAN